MDKARILVVDDNPSIRKGLSLRLRANGYEVLLAADALSATAVLVKEKPDLVILDLGLPCGDGFVVMERLQNNDSLGSIPVIVLTGRDSEETRNRALQAGAVAFFQKPVDDGELLSAIRKALDLSAPGTSRGLNILVVDDNAALQIAFKKILSAAGHAVQVASDGEEGLRLALDKTPDIIVLDMLLPKLAGVEVLRALKQNPATKTIPVIVLSGLPQSNEAKLRKEGAVSYLEKSRLENSDALLQAINALLPPARDELRQETFLGNAIRPENV
jgi:DNA-binding response OmpR family regulator